MAARSRARQERDRSRSAQPAEDDSDNEGEPDQPMEGRNSSKLYAALFVVPGIFLYVYMLYIVWANLLYPASLTPFMPGNSSASSSSTDDGTYCLKAAILINVALLVLFVVQHSLMASEILKRCWRSLELSPISRLVYVFATCCVIQFIHHFWQATPSHTLWECRGQNLVLLLKAIHTICWLSIACSLFTVDYLELLGIKQLYYSYNGFRDPLSYKSAEQQYLFHHMRHPILTAPLIIMWAVPVMTYDRLLLAVMLPLYMACVSALDVSDMRYVKRMFASKREELLN